MSTHPIVAALAFAALAACPACSSTYQPMPSPRIAVVQESGKPVLVKAGRHYDIGLFGGGLAEAVLGVPEAEEYAESFRNHNIAGFSMSIGGLAFTIGGAALLGSSASSNGGGSEASAITGSMLVLSGLGLVIAGFVLAISAPPRMWDAINAHNDGVTPMPPPMWLPPPGAQPLAPLQAPPPPPPASPPSPPSP